MNVYDVYNPILFYKQQADYKEGSESKKKIVPRWTKECDKVIKRN